MTATAYPTNTRPAERLSKRAALGVWLLLILLAWAPVFIIWSI